MSGWIAPRGADLVWFSGADSVRFLNDLISQEIAKMEPGQVRRSLLLGPQGKLDHILWVLRGTDLVGLVTDEGRGPELAATINRYRIRVKVDIEADDSPGWVVVDEADPGSWTGGPSETVRADISWKKTPRTLVVGERPDLPDGSDEEYELARIASGEPRWGVDVDEGTIPQEAGLVEAGVDFTKGCYLGQELVARIDSRGRVVKRLRILELDEPVESGSPIVAEDGSEVGAMTSAAGLIGMGMVRFEIQPGAVVRVGSAHATVRESP